MRPYARPDQPLAPGAWLRQGRLSGPACPPAHPDINYLGIDITDKVLILAKRKVEAAYAARGIPADNVKIASLDIERLGNAFTPDATVWTRIYINFCNPWSKNAGSNKHRLTHPAPASAVPPADGRGRGDLVQNRRRRPVPRQPLHYFPAAGFEITWQTFDLHANEPDWNLRTEHEGMFSEHGHPHQGADRPQGTRQHRDLGGAQDPGQRAGSRGTAGSRRSTRPAGGCRIPD